MAKTKTVFYCTNCGNETPKWMGRCPSCGAYNTMEEHVEKPVAAGKAKSAPVGMSRKPQRIREITSDGEIRFSTGMGELDRVLGGGAVAGSLVLVGGAPGIGKSTLLLQICSSLCVGRRVLYVSGEESERQLKLRAERLGVAPEELFILSETRLSDIVDAAEAMNPDILIVDSIQTLYNEENESSPGSVSQVKDCTMTMMQLSKSQGITVFVVGHINKDGNIAGPKVLEHMVDCVLYFEGDQHTAYRILRAAKNRFGATNEIGVFEMRDSGLVEIQNHSYNCHSFDHRNGVSQTTSESKESYAKFLSSDVWHLQNKIAYVTGVAPNTFTYPFGAFSENTDEVLREIGFQATLSCTEGISVIKRGDPDCLYRLKRHLRPPDKSPEEFFKFLK